MFSCCIVVWKVFLFKIQLTLNLNEVKVKCFSANKFHYIPNKLYAKEYIFWKYCLHKNIEIYFSLFGQGNTFKNDRGRLLFILHLHLK